MNLRPRLFALCALLVLACVASPSAKPQAAAPAAAAQQTVKPNFTADTVIYVSDFELDASNVTTDQSGGNRPRIIESPRKREEHDPQAQAAKLVNTMSTALVDDLKKAGYKAERVPPGGSPPKAGAWVHGVFTEVDEGNSRRRAIIGFGAGQASMDLYVTLSDLAQPDKPLYNAAQDADSKKKPGAVITMNPYVAAAKFVMEKKAPEKMVKKTAGEIAAQVAAQMQSYGATPKK